MTTSVIGQLGASNDEVERGILPAHWFSSEELFAIEREKVFGRGWMFVGHLSEIAAPGDFQLRKLAGESVIFVHGHDDRHRVLVNSCRHRGGMICRSDKGNAEHFECPWHAWTYSNDGALVGVPGAVGYSADFDKSDHGLLEVRSEQHAGFVFATFDNDAQPLHDELSGMDWYLDLAARRSERGLKVVGSPTVWTIPANWKFAADNFVGDTGHFASVHGCSLELGLYPFVELDYFANIQVGDGHGLFFNGIRYPKPGRSFLELRGYPVELVDSLHRNLSEGQVEFLDRSIAYGATIFPNTSFFDPVFADLDGLFPAGFCSFFSIRVWQPVSATQTEVWSWLLVEGEFDEQQSASIYNSYMRTFGASGMLEGDDVAAWEGGTRTAGGLGNRNIPRLLIQGHDLPVDTEMPGPGTAYASPNPFACGENSQRGFYKRWYSEMSR